MDLNFQLTLWLNLCLLAAKTPATSKRRSNEAAETIIIVPSQCSDRSIEVHFVLLINSV